MSILIYGIGYNSKREHKARHEKKSTIAYATWFSMINRCYNPKYHAKYPTYIDCSTAAEWLDFQNFADWFEIHEYSDKNYALDKDLLIRGNRVYSPESACFIPYELNALLNDKAKSRGFLPQGVDMNNITGRYRASLSINSKKKHLGYFDCPNEAHQAYKKAKEAYVKEKALEWKDRIADDVFKALMNWQLIE